MLLSLMIGLAGASHVHAASPLVAHWRFDELEGSAARDETGRYDGTLSPSGVYRMAEGISGGALSVVGSHGGYVVFPPSLPVPTSAYSISLWCMGGSVGHVPARLFMRQTPGTSDGVAILLAAHGNGPAIGTSGTSIAANSSGGLGGMRWHHVVMTYEAGGKHRLYANGSSFVAEAPAIEVSPSATLPCIGCEDADPTDGAVSPFADAIIDDLRVYHGVLTPRQVDYLRDHPTGDLSFSPEPAPEFRPAGGSYLESVTVSIERWLHATTIHYTTDGSEPLTTSPRYEQPLVLTSNTTFRARCFLDGAPVSPETQATFEVTQPPTPTGNLTARWRFDDGWLTRDVALDDTGRHHASLSRRGAQWVPYGISGGAVSLESAPPGYLTPGAGFPRLEPPFTISTWFRVPNQGSWGGGTLFGQHLLGSMEGTYLAISSVNQLNGFSGGTHVFTEGAPLNDGSWHHAVLTHESGGRLRLYLDGTNGFGSVTAGPTVVSQAETTLGGAGTPSPIGMFPGSLDEVQVYDFAANRDQVDQLFRSPGNTLVPAGGPEIHVLPNGGSFQDSVTFALATAQAGADLRFTLDGSDPTYDSPRYQDPIVLSTDTQVRARLFRSETPASEIVTAHFLVTRGTGRPDPGFLLARLRFDSMIDGLFPDDTGWNHGRPSPTGAYLVDEGVSGKSVLLQGGAQGQVDLGDALPLISSPATLSLWVKIPPGSASPSAKLFSKHAADSPGGYSLSLDESGRRAIATVGDAPPLLHPQTLDDGSWHHLALVVTDYGRLRLLVDGTAAPEDRRVEAIQPSGQWTTLGAKDPHRPRGTSFSGGLDELHVYDFAATQEQVLQLISNPGASLTTQSPTLPGVPEILSQPRDQTAHPGESLTFAVEVQGTPPFRYQWFFGEQPLPGADAPILTLQSLSAQDTGFYSVRVSNGSGFAISRAARLVIEPFPDHAGPARFVLHPVSQIAELGKPLTFRAAAVGAPPIHFRWTINGGAMQAAHEPELVIESVPAHLDGASIRAVVFNDYGLVESKPAIISLRIPNPPTIDPPGGTYVGSVRVHLGADGGFSNLRFTLDGRDPTPDDPRPGGVLHLTQSALLKVCAVSGSQIISPIASASFEILPRPTPAGPLLAHWRFDEPEGASIAADTTGLFPGRLSATGAFLGAQGREGGALRLERSQNGFVAMGDVLPLTNTPFSIACWLKTPPGDTTPNAVLVSKHISGSANGYYISLNASSHTIAAQIGNTPLGADTSIHDGEWHHVVVTHSPDSKARLFIDGAPARDFRETSGNSESAAGFTVGGLEFDRPLGLFTGLLDDVQIYNLELSDREVELLRANPGRSLGGIEPPTVQIVPPGGRFDRTVSVILAPRDASTVVRYTLDGSPPNGDSPIYSQPLELSASAQVIAVAFLGATPVGPPSSAAFEILMRPQGGLIAHWRFDETEGMSVAEFTGRFPGQLSPSGASFSAEAVAGRSLRLLRADAGFVHIPTPIPLTNTAFTISLWFRVPGSDVTRYSYLLANTDRSESQGYALFLDPLTRVNAYLSGNAMMWDPRVVYNEGGWHHLALTRTSEGRTRLHFDGGPAIQDAVLPPVAASSAPLLIGAMASEPPANTFEGWIDDVQIYDSVLSDADLEALNQAPGFNLSQVPSDTIVMAPHGGQFTTPVEVSLGSSIPGLDIRYTTDDSPPHSDSPQFTGSLLITNAVQLKAAGFRAGQQVTRLARAMFIVNLPRPPAVHTVPTDQTALVGSEVYYYLGVGGSHPMTFHWYRDGQLFAVNQSGDLRLRNLTLSDAGNFWVVVTNAAGTTTSKQFSLQVVRGAPEGTRELLAHWRFDASQGTTAHDETGRYPAILSPTGAAFVNDGRSGHCLALDPSKNGHALVGDVLPLAGQSFSISLWLRTPPQLSSGAAAIISRHAPGKGQGYFVALQESGNSVQSYQGAGGILHGTTPVNDGQWHHVVVTHQIEGVTRLFVDGSPAESESVAHTVLPTPAQLVIGGWDSPPPVGQFTGLLDDIQIFSFALSTVEVGHLFTHPGSSLPDLVPSDVTISPTEGAYSDSILVTLSSRGPGTRVRYTTDGSDPTPTSLLYTEPFPVTRSTLVKAAAFEDPGGERRGPIAQAEFLIQTPIPLIITDYPADVIVHEGETAEFSVRVGGSGPFFYRWRRLPAGAELGSDATLTLRGVGPDQAGRYLVTIRNASGAAASATAQLTVLPAVPPPQPPRLLSSPVTQSVPLGSTIALQLSVAGDPPLTFAWYLNQQLLPSATSDSLVLSPVGPENAGTYFVDVSNAHGSIRSASFSLEVVVPPPQAPALVSVPPEAVFAREGAPASLEIMASGSTPLHYQWLRAGRPLPGATFPSLHLPSPRLDDTGPYSVIVSNSVGTTLSPVTLLIVSAIPRETFGSVRFVNSLAGSIPAPVFHADGTRLLDDPRFVAQLYAGSSSTSLKPVGAPARFRSGPGAGSWDPGSDSLRFLNGISPGATAWVQVRVWNLSQDSTFEDAVAAQNLVGESTPFTVITGGAGIPSSFPANLDGLTTFRLDRHRQTLAGDWNLNGRLDLGDPVSFLQRLRSGPPLDDAELSELDLTPDDGLGIQDVGALLRGLLDHQESLLPGDPFTSPPQDSPVQFELDSAHVIEGGVFRLRLSSVQGSPLPAGLRFTLVYPTEALALVSAPSNAWETGPLLRRDAVLVSHPGPHSNGLASIHLAIADAEPWPHGQASIAEIPFRVLPAAARLEALRIQTTQGMATDMGWDLWQLPEESIPIQPRPPLPAVITRLRLDPQSHLQLEFSTQVGLPVSIDGSADLLQWDTLSSTVPATDKSVLSLPTPQSHHYFYRIRYGD